VAAGIFVSATFFGPFVWDVAAGVVLLRAAGLEVWVLQDRRWARFERFEAPARVREERAPTLRDWRQSLTVGTPEGVAPALRERRGRLWRYRARLHRALLRFI
jgi:hypothetical protein